MSCLCCSSNGLDCAHRCLCQGPTSNIYHIHIKLTFWEKEVNSSRAGDRILIILILGLKTQYCLGFQSDELFSTFPAFNRCIIQESGHMVRWFGKMYRCIAELTEYWKTEFPKWLTGKVWAVFNSGMECIVWYPYISKTKNIYIFSY